MIILKGIVCEYLESVEVELPRANIDPRPNDTHDYHRFRCEYHDNGTTVTITRPNNFWATSFSFRVYESATETVPSFDSKIYTYLGEDDEKAPHDTTMLIIHPSVTVIKQEAFASCYEIKKCFMHDGVHTIEECAFSSCKAMKVIRLSQSLTHIGEEAFCHCVSLEAVFLPPSVNQIDKRAFLLCYNLQIFSLPLSMDISQIGNRMLERSHIFFQTTQIQQYVWIEEEEYDNSNRVHQDIIHFYRNQVPPLHKECLHTHVTHQTIQQCINTHGQATASITDHNGMTPLHILAMNPHANISALLACLDLNMTMAIVGDSRGNTPLDYLRVHRDSIDDHTSLVSSLCMHRYAAAAASASSQDHLETSTNSNKYKKRKRANDE